MVKVLPFCVPIPKTIELDDISLIHNNNNNDDDDDMEQPNPKGIVGTITIMNHQTAIVWFGWGDLIPTNNETSSFSEKEDQQQNIGNGTYVHSLIVFFFLSFQIHHFCWRSNVDDYFLYVGLPQMGHMVLAMPRIQYAGRGHSSTTQLMGGESEEDMMIGSQMASRLSQKLKYPVFVSCSISGSGASFYDGYNSSIVSQKAAAMAEHSIRQILLKQQQQQQQQQQT